MKIQSLRYREGGTRVELDSDNYHFAPNDKGHHVAEVSNAKHLKLFLSTEAFAVYDAATASSQADAPEEKAETGGAGPIITVADLGDMTDADLRMHFTALFGKKPVGKSRAKLIANLTAELEKRAAAAAAQPEEEPEGEQDDFDGDDE